MLDLAFQFSTHLALSGSQISVCLQWEFQPTRAQPLQSVVEGCVRKTAGEARRGEKKGIVHKLVKMKNDNE